MCCDPTLSIVVSCGAHSTCSSLGGSAHLHVRARRTAIGDACESSRTDSCAALTKCVDTGSSRIRARSLAGGAEYHHDDDSAPLRIR
jgi:hypothetical protein